ncbi:hypothetical protein [Alteromonas sp. M12]|uniref:hypothetical protein n=1 Tax=Alteromonas sp. M12 TaxID=3135644 RepID=UPI00319DB7A8
MNASINKICKSAGKLIGLISILVISNVANATLINFDDVTASWTAYANSSMYTSGNVTFSHSGSFAALNSSTNDDRLSGNTTTALYSFNNSTITMSSTETFNLVGFDGGETWDNLPHAWSNSIQVIGYFAAGGSITQVFDLDTIKDEINGLQTFTASGFTGLSLLEFSGVCLTVCNPEFSLDNVSISSVAVSEPATIGLLGIMLLTMLRIRSR